MAIDMTSDGGTAYKAAAATTSSAAQIDSTSTALTVGGIDATIAAERNTAFRAARRHSLFVRIFKLALPLSTILLIGIYGIVVSSNQKASPRPGAKIDFGSPVITSDGFAMENPKYTGAGLDGSHYFVTAKQAFPDIKKPSRITMNDISGTLTQPDRVKTHIAAKRGLFDNDKGRLDLFERIDINSGSGLTARLNSASIFIRDGRIVTTQPIAAQMPGASIRANAMTLLVKKRLAAFTGGVAMQLQPQKGNRTGNGNKTRSSAAASPASPALLSGNSDKPIDITAGRLDIDDTKKTAIFKHNVRVIQEQSTLNAATLEIQYEGSAALPGEQQQAASKTGTKTKSAKGAKLKRITALQNVVLVSTDGRRATSDRLDYDASTDRAVLSGNVVISQGEGQATSQRAILDNKTSTAFLEGNVIMTQGTAQIKSNKVALDRKAETALITGNVLLTQDRNILRGGRLFIDQKAATSRLTMPGGNKRIHATFYQTATAKKTKPTTKPKPKRSTFSATRFKSDPNAPIKIDARQLDVNDKQKSAIFRGNVVATQGDMIIRAATLIASYSGDTGMGLQTGLQKPVAKKRTKSKKAATLKRIEARTKVRITSADGQTASGDWADFDVKANTVVLGGDVVLKKGSTIILGEKLHIDMTTGKARIVPKRGGRAAKGRKIPGVPGSRTCPAGQTCLRLIPGELEKQFKSKKGSGASGWTSSTSKSGKKKSARKKKKSAGPAGERLPWQPSTSASEAFRSR